MKKLLKTGKFNKKVFLIVIGASIFMYWALVITNNLDSNTQKMIDRVREEKLEKGLKMTEMKLDYNNCINKVAVNYVWAWNSVCKDRGLSDNCPLEEANSSILNDALKQDKENCLSIYRIGMDAISKTWNKGIIDSWKD